MFLLNVVATISVIIFRVKDRI